MKKLLSIMLVVLLLAGMAVTGTMAYLTSEDSDVNVMTLGNVKIAQHEYERKVDASGNYVTDTVEGQTSYMLQPFTQGKALLLYGQANTNLTVNNCVFNDKGGLTDLKAAIEIGNDYNKSYTLTVNDTTVNGYEINDKGISTGSTLWANKNSMPQDKLNVVVDGVDVY